jgi:hypothetical protein
LSLSSAAWSFAELDVLEKDCSKGFGSRSNAVLFVLFVVVIVSGDVISNSDTEWHHPQKNKHVQIQPTPSIKMRSSLPIRQQQLDFARIYSKLGLGKESIAAVQAFRKRYAEAQRVNAQLSSQPTSVDVASYRSRLRNKEIVDEAEKALSAFKPTTYDVSAHLKAIDAFQAKAVRLSPICHPGISI